jgi:hypothetical protein
MDPLTVLRFAVAMTTTTTTAAADVPTLPADPGLGATVRKAVAGRSYGALATTSADGRSHVAGILYAIADGALWISTHRDSRKARNVAENPSVALTVAVRRLPVGPPASVSLQGRATVVELDDPEVVALAAAGALGKITSHGELELDGGCFIKVALPRRVPAYGLGMSLRALVRNPLDAGRVAEVDWT